MGNALSDLAKMKPDIESESLYKAAIEKYEKARELGGLSYNLSCGYAGMGDDEHALHFLEESLKKEEVTGEFVLNDDGWKNYRDNDAFKKLLKKYT